MLQPGVALLALRAALLESILTALDLHPNRETPRGLTHKTKMQPVLGLATKLVKQIFLKCQGPSLLLLDEGCLPSLLVLFGGSWLEELGLAECSFCGNLTTSNFSRV